MTKIAALFLVLPFAAVTMAQTELNWADLESGITWQKAQQGSSYPSFLNATFSSQLTMLEGQKITLTGFLLVLDGRKSIYMLSKFPMASCFFCGGSGAETVAEISFVEKPSFGMDDLITVTGSLRLNGNDPTRCYYSIERAEGLGF